VGTFVLAARGPFSLAAGTRFLEGFTPAAYAGTARQPLEMAFPVEGTWQAAGVRVREHPGGAECEVVSPPAPGRDLLAAVRAQVARILSLDVDGSGFPADRPLTAWNLTAWKGLGALPVPRRDRAAGSRHRPVVPGGPAGRLTRQEPGYIDLAMISSATHRATPAG
jgi:hypothetical protein